MSRLDHTLFQFFLYHFVKMYRTKFNSYTYLLVIKIFIEGFLSLKDVEHPIQSLAIKIHDSRFYCPLKNTLKMEIIDTHTYCIALWEVDYGRNHLKITKKHLVKIFFWMSLYTEMNSPGFCYMTIYAPSDSRQRSCLPRQ